MRAVVYRNVPKLLEETETLGFNVTMEMHTPYWEEIFKLRPDAKVIHLTRDFESWYNSFAHGLQNFPLMRYPLRQLLRPQYQVVDSFMAHLFDDIDGCAYLTSTCELGSPEHRKIMFNAYQRITTRIREVVPPEQLLVLDVVKGQGYPELCAFLRVAEGECPDGPFPRANDRSEMAAAGYVLKTIMVLGYVLPALGAWWIWRLCTRSRRRCSCCNGSCASSSSGSASLSSKSANIDAPDAAAKKSQ